MEVSLYAYSFWSGFRSAGVFRCHCLLMHSHIVNLPHLPLEDWWEEVQAASPFILNLVSQLTPSMSEFENRKGISMLDKNFAYPTVVGMRLFPIKIHYFKRQKGEVKKWMSFFADLCISQCGYFWAFPFPSIITRENRRRAIATMELWNVLV